MKRKSLFKYYYDEQQVFEDLSTKSILWIRIDDNILDVTGFIDEHPGGGDIILKYSMKNCTNIFNQIHSIEAKMMAKQFIIGKLIKDQQQQQ